MLYLLNLMGLKRDPSQPPLLCLMHYKTTPCISEDKLPKAFYPGIQGRQPLQHCVTKRDQNNSAFCE